MGDDQEQLRQHWKDLAVQLGLEPVEQSTPPAAPTSAKEAEKASASLVHPEGTESSEEKIMLEERFARKEARTSQVEAPPVKAPDSDQFVGVTEASGIPAESPEEAVADESPPERRPRRGRRPEKGEPETSSHRRRDSGVRRREETPVSSSEDLSQTNGPEDSSEPEVSEERERAFVEDVAAAEDRKEEDESDADDVDTLSDWNVPSWAELIASLYRPER